MKPVQNRPIASGGSIEAMLTFRAVTRRVSWQHGEAHRRDDDSSCRLPSQGALTWPIQLQFRWLRRIASPEMAR